RSAPPPAVECAAVARQAVHEALCGRDDGVRSMQARFRAEVEAGGSTRSAEGVLVWRAPGELRVKLFTLAGLTVYDALWTGDAHELRGVVRQPLSDREETFVLGPSDVPDAPDADLSLVLWSLWQPRCRRSPEPLERAPYASDSGASSAPSALEREAENATYALDPEPARATGRSARLGDGAIREETLTRTRANGAIETVVARYVGYDCAATPLPRNITIEAPASGWRARVTILSQSRDVTLDDALFALPGAVETHAGS
ncbi:hypothetical protein K2Z84_03805, partial [Candidatus Binatia bacterium]|nr:hypothetical protein [Candidatus Binatia bacterium]